MLIRCAMWSTSNLSPWFYFIDLIFFLLISYKENCTSTSSLEFWHRCKKPQKVFYCMETSAHQSCRSAVNYSTFRWVQGIETIYIESEVFNSNFTSFILLFWISAITGIWSNEKSCICKWFFVNSNSECVFIHYRFLSFSA